MSGILEARSATRDADITREILIKLPRGLHSRPSARLAQLAQSFQCAIAIVSENGEADAKSMLDILSLALPFNAKILLAAKGEDAEKAIDACASFMARARE